jgi:hypothetical protein
VEKHPTTSYASALEPGLGEPPLIRHHQPDAACDSRIMQHAQLAGRGAWVGLEGDGGEACLGAAGEHRLVQAELFALAQESAGGETLPHDQGNLIIGADSDWIGDHPPHHRSEAPGRDDGGGHLAFAEQQRCETWHKIEVQQTLDPTNDHFRQRSASWAVTHQAIGVDIDPGIAEDATKRQRWVDVNAFHDQLQIVGT